MSGNEEPVRAGNREVSISNPDKELFGPGGVTKRELVGYYSDMAKAMLPYLANRPLALHRFPDGIHTEGFFQKQRPDYAPVWVHGATVQRNEGSTTMVVCDNAATLAWLANQAAITLHPWLSRQDDPNTPDRLIVDLDPPRDDFAMVCWAARRVRELFEELDMPGYLMTTGSRGLHVVAPIRREYEFDEARDVARGMADLLAERFPDRLTTQVRKNKRHGRLFLDILRNSYAQHSVAPYAVRPLRGAPVAAPLHWNELGETASAQEWTVRNIVKRLAATGDPWQGMGRRACSLRRVSDRLRKVRVST